jgi:hypothetical protein
MTMTSISAPGPVQAMGRTLRMLLATATILILLAAAFVVGHVTVSSSSAPGTAPAVRTQVQSSNSGISGICQQVGHYRSAGC